MTRHKVGRLGEDTMLTTRYKIAELTSGTGAFVLGVGLGIAIAERARPALMFIFVVGLLLHGWGMFDLRRQQASKEGSSTRLAAALYWICWILLVLLVAAVAIWIIRP